MNYYEAMGISRDASLAEIRSTYRALAKKLHPDLNPTDSRAEERFKALNAIHQVLSDPAKRKAYDAYLHSQEQPQVQVIYGWSSGTGTITWTYY